MTDEEEMRLRQLAAAIDAATDRGGAYDDILRLINSAGSRGKMLNKQVRPALTADDIRVGKTYRAKKPVMSALGYNDRTVIHKGQRTVQYDGSAVKLGSRYPTVPMEKFLRWASHEVEEE